MPGIRANPRLHGGTGLPWPLLLVPGGGRGDFCELASVRTSFHPLFVVFFGCFFGHLGSPNAAKLCNCRQISGFLSFCCISDFSCFVVPVLGGFWCRLHLRGPPWVPYARPLEYLGYSFSTLLCMLGHLTGPSGVPERSEGLFRHAF